MTFYEALDEVLNNGRTAVTVYAEGKLYMKMVPADRALIHEEPDMRKAFKGDMMLGMRYKDNKIDWPKAFNTRIKMSHKIMESEWKLIKEKQ